LRKKGSKTFFYKKREGGKTKGRKGARGNSVRGLVAARRQTFLCRLKEKTLLAEKKKGNSVEKDKEVC
jgi:hypothetical protein